MAHLIDIRVVCDRCQQDGEERPGPENLRVSFDGGPVRELDLCAEHHKEYVALRDFVEQHGRQIKGKGKAAKQKAQPSGEFACPECGLQTASSVGLSAHIRLVHNDVEPMTCPHCQKICSGKQGLTTHIRIHDPEHDVPVTCDRCGREFPNAHGLRAHAAMHRRHDRQNDDSLLITGT